MTKGNVLNLEELKVWREKRLAQDAYQRYLASLPHGQLEGEINFILDEFSLGRSHMDLLSKVNLIQRELVSRADSTGKVQIAAVAQGQLLSPET